MQVRGGAALTVVAALLPALLLSGCVSQRVPPPGPSEADLAASRVVRIDQAWKNSGLEGTIERPAIDVPSRDASMEELSACLASNGIEGWSLSDGPDGPNIGSSDGGTVDAVTLLQFYECFAQYPTNGFFDRPQFSDAQYDYLYDYYQSWVIPCLAAEGHLLEGVPTRIEFRSPGYRWWTPYDQAGFYVADDYDSAVTACGDPYAGLVPERAAQGGNATSIEYFLR